jgi:DNA-directed RNA polymerase specialized sigma24 family protein
VTLTELELIVARDEETMGRFYDVHVNEVRRFCAALCPADRLGEAVDATLVGFLARASEATAGTRPDELLRKAAREVAASRMEPGGEAGAGAGPLCRAMPELLAARANQELSGAEDQMLAHLESCDVCRESAARLEEAERAFVAPSEDPAAAQGRETWVQLAQPPGIESTAARQSSRDAAVAAETPADDPAQPASSANPEPSAAAEGHRLVRARRGGLIGAVRRLTDSHDVEPPQEASTEGSGP